MNNVTLSQTLWTIWIHTFMNYKLQHLHVNKTMTYIHNVVQNVISNKTLIIFPLASKHRQLLSWPMKCCSPFQNLKLNKIIHSTKDNNMKCETDSMESRNNSTRNSNCSMWKFNARIEVSTVLMFRIQVSGSLQWAAGLLMDSLTLEDESSMFL